VHGGLPVISSHGQLGTGQLVTYASRHTVNSSHNKPPQCRAVRFNYLPLTSLSHSTDD